MIKPSSKVRNGLNFHLRQSQQEHSLSNPNAQFILSAEFDNKNGAILKHQYPKTIPGFKNIGNEQNSSHLASLMIPNCIENYPGKPDFTVFVLYKKGQTYQLFPPSKFDKNDVDNSFAIKEEDDEEDPARDSRSTKNGVSLNNRTMPTEEESPIFFLNVVNAITDLNNERGASIKAVALGTTMMNFYTFKPLITMVLDFYMRSNNDINILIDCFNMINSLDLSFVRRFHSNSVLQNILNSLNDDEITSKILDPNGRSLPKILRVNELPKRDKFGNKLSFKSRILEYKFSTFRPRTLPAYFTKIPLQIDLIKYDRIKIETNYNDFILKFLNKFISYISELKSSDYSWRLIINSTKLTKDYICQFVLALSNLLNCFNGEYFDNSLMIVFPYIELSLLDLLKEQTSKHTRREKMFFIIGVSNPIFQYHNDAWDFYYDFDSDTLLTADLLKPNNFNGVKTEGLKSIFSGKYNASQDRIIMPSLPENNGLMLQLISLLINGQHDNETVLNTFKKANIVQLLKLTNSQPHKQVAEMILKDQYIINYKDFILFPELFEYNSLKLLRLLNELEEGLNILLWKTLSAQAKRKQLQKLYYVLKQIYKFISMNKKNLGIFLNIALNYPLCSAFDGVDVLNMNLGGFSVEELISKKRSGVNSVESIFTSSVSHSTIDQFNSYRSLDLLLLPLFMNPYIEEEQPFSIGDLGPPVLHSRTSSAKGAYYHSVSSLSMISSIYETNDLMSHDYRFDSNAHDDVLTISTVKSNFSDQFTLINKCRQMSVKILYRIQRHHIGNLLFDLKMNSLFKIVYEVSKVELFDQRVEINEPATTISEQHQGIKNFSKISRIHYSDPARPESAMKVSISRKDLLNDLNVLGTKFEYQSNFKKKSPPTTANELLNSLSRLEFHNA